MLRSMRSRIILLILILNVSLTMIVAFITLSFHYKETQNTEERYIEQLTKDTMESLEIKNKKYREISLQIMTSELIQQKLPRLIEGSDTNGVDQPDYNFITYKSEVIDLISQYYNTSNEIEAIRVWFDKEHVIFVGQSVLKGEQSYEKLSGFIKAKQKTPYLTWVVNDDKTISQWQIIKNFKTGDSNSASYSIIGAIEIRMKPDRFLQSTDKLKVLPNIGFVYTNSDMQSLFQFPDEAGFNIITNDLKEINFNENESKIDDGHHVFFIEKANSGLYLITMYSTRNFYKYVLNAGITIIFVSILSLVVSILCVVYISKLLTRPFSTLLTGIDQFGAGSFDRHIPPVGIREIDQIGSGLNNMAAQINELFQAMYRAKQSENKMILEKKQAEFKALYNQINPHFLFNTLQSINSVAIRHTGEETEINQMIVHLSRLLRESIYNIGNVITVENELNNLWAYVHLQHIRYADMFSIKWDIDYHALQKKIPCLVLQPIMENAIKYGVFNANIDQVLIKVTSKLVEDELQLTISDQGCGMDEEQLQTIWERLNASDHDQVVSTSGVGLYNTHHRLLYEFGERYRLEIHSKLHAGTDVTIKIRYPIESND